MMKFFWPDVGMVHSWEVVYSVFLDEGDLDLHKSMHGIIQSKEERVLIFLSFLGQMLNCLDLDSLHI